MTFKNEKAFFEWSGVIGYTITRFCIGCGVCVKVCPVGAISGEKKSRHVIDPGLCIECGACGRVCPKSSVRDDRGERIEKLKRALWLRPVIDKERCFACENCVEACPVDALAMAGSNLPLNMNKAVLSRPDACVSCGTCVRNCLFDAICLKGAA